MKSLFILPTLLLVLINFSCRNQTTDPKSQFTSDLKDPSATGYYYASSETSDLSIQMLTSPQASGVIDLSKTNLPMTLRYTGVKDDKGSPQIIYKTELVKKDKGIALVASEIGGKSVWEQMLTDHVPDLDTIHVPRAGYDSLQSCIADWNCLHRGELECLANKTCQNQYGAMTCCLTNGQCFSVHVVIPPTSWKCQLRYLIPDLDGLVLSSR